MRPHLEASGRFLWKPIAALVVAATCAACAYTYTNDDGARRIIGFVDMEIRPAVDARTVAGDVVDIRTFGLSLLDLRDETSLTVGYQRQIAAALRDNALVLGNPLTAMRDDNISNRAKGSVDGK